jgi:hypothetical protein
MSAKYADLIERAKEAGLPWRTVLKRVDRGMTLDEAVTKTVREKNMNKGYDRQCVKPDKGNFANWAETVLKDYRAKAFAKPEPQHPEYYEGFDNCVKGIGIN